MVSLLLFPTNAHPSILTHLFNLTVIEYVDAHAHAYQLTVYKWINKYNICSCTMLHNSNLILGISDEIVIALQLQANILKLNVFWVFLDEKFEKNHEVVTCLTWSARSTA